MGGCAGGEGPTTVVEGRGIWGAGRETDDGETVVPTSHCASVTRGTAPIVSPLAPQQAFVFVAVSHRSRAPGGPWNIWRGGG